MPHDQIKIEGNIARFNVNYFGMYQVIKTEAKITKEVSSETKSELNSKRDVKRMEQISLAPASLYYKSDSALVAMNFPTIANQSIESCRYSVDNDGVYHKLIYR